MSFSLITKYYQPFPKSRGGKPFLVLLLITGLGLLMGYIHTSMISMMTILVAGIILWTMAAFVLMLFFGGLDIITTLYKAIFKRGTKSGNANAKDQESMESASVAITVQLPAIAFLIPASLWCVYGCITYFFNDIAATTVAFSCVWWLTYGCVCVIAGRFGYLQAPKILVDAAVEILESCADDITFDGDD